MKKIALNIDFIELLELRSALRFRMSDTMRDSNSTIEYRLHTLEILMKLYDYMDSVIACEVNKKG